MSRGRKSVDCDECQPILDLSGGDVQYSRTFDVDTHRESRQKVFEDLYNDHEMRQRRWLARFEDKCRQEDEEFFQQQMQSKSRDRSFDHQSFLAWYGNRLGRYHAAEQVRQEQHRFETRQRASAELAECSFAPHSPRRASAGSDGLKGKSSSGGRRKEPSLAHELVALQTVQINALHKLDDEEQEQRAQLEKESSEALEIAVRDSKLKLKRFADSEEGRMYLAERVQSYIELNRGMGESTAMSEAQADLMRASESKLKVQAAVTLKRRVKSLVQRKQLERLKVAWDLIQLQRRCEALLSRGMPRSTLRGFDMHLVDRLTSEAWYIEAREVATRILNAEVPPSAAKSKN